jgi:hypothetical protein
VFRALGESLAYEVMVALSELLGEKGRRNSQNPDAAEGSTSMALSGLQPCWRTTRP